MQHPPRAKVFVEGRYRKLTRDLPQTVHHCPECKGHPRRRQRCTKCEGFGKLSRDSVQELVGWVLGKGFGTRKHKFHGAGREDVDVRMLGRGRPFVVELLQPKVLNPDLAEMEATINDRNAGRLEVLGLHWSEKERVRVLKETKHAKRYQAHVRTEGVATDAALEALVGRQVVVQQQTPQRVAHRRADLVRERWIRFDALERGTAPEELTVTLTTEHGTYVKEAVSGEDGRSEPSLTSLLGLPCHCVELDVLEILGEDGEEPGESEGFRVDTPFGAGLD